MKIFDFQKIKCAALPYKMSINNKDFPHKAKSLMFESSVVKLE